MVECPIPQDILKYKPKFVANLSVRETIFGGLGVSLGLLTYFVWGAGMESEDVKMFLSFAVILPFFLIGFVKIYDQPFEKIALTLVLENFLYPAKRKKEVHFREFEKYERTRYWMKPEEEDSSEEALSGIEYLALGQPQQESTPGDISGETSPDKEKKEKHSKKGKKKPQKVSVKKSETYKGIK